VIHNYCFIVIIVSRNTLQSHLQLKHNNNKLTNFAHTYLADHSVYNSLTTEWPALSGAHWLYSSRSSSRIASSASAAAAADI